MKTSFPILPLVLVTMMTAWLAGETIQVDVHEVLNARVIVTLSNGAVSPVTNGGIGTMYHGPSAEGAMAWATQSASKGGEGLPDDGRFAATARHPEVVLNYRNTDATGMQARKSMGPDTFTFAVPARSYTSMLLCMVSEGGASRVQITLSYEGGSTDVRNMEAPDFGVRLKEGDTEHCALISDLNKWDGNGKVTEEKNHWLYVLETRPDPKKTLRGITVTKQRSGNMTFYGATGVAAK